MNFICKNVNPTGMSNCDCTVNAFTILQKSDWHTVYKKLCAVGNQVCDMPNSVRTVERYAVINRLQPVMIIGNYTVSKFVETHRFGRFAVMTSNHMTAVINGVIYDTIDCTRQRVKKAWKVP